MVTMLTEDPCERIAELRMRLSGDQSGFWELEKHYLNHAMWTPPGMGEGKTDVPQQAQRQDLTCTPMKWGWQLAGGVGVWTKPRRKVKKHRGHGGFGPAPHLGPSSAEFMRHLTLDRGVYARVPPCGLSPHPSCQLESHDVGRAWSKS